MIHVSWFELIAVKEPQTVPLIVTTVSDPKLLPSNVTIVPPLGEPTAGAIDVRVMPGVVPGFDGEVDVPSESRPNKNKGPEQEVKLRSELI